MIYKAGSTGRVWCGQSSHKIRGKIFSGIRIVILIMSPAGLKVRGQAGPGEQYPCLSGLNTTSLPVLSPWSCITLRRTLRQVRIDNSWRHCNLPLLLRNILTSIFSPEGSEGVNMEKVGKITIFLHRIVLYYESSKYI